MAKRKSTNGQTTFMQFVTE